MRDELFQLQEIPGPKSLLSAEAGSAHSAVSLSAPSGPFCLVRTGSQAGVVGGEKGRGRRETDGASEGEEPPPQGHAHEALKADEQLSSPSGQPDSLWGRGQARQNRTQ